MRICKHIQQPPYRVHILAPYTPRFSVFLLVVPSFQISVRGTGALKDPYNTVLNAPLC